MGKLIKNQGGDDYSPSDSEEVRWSETEGRRVHSAKTSTFSQEAR